ncbi:MAG: hypothetical protein HKP41_12560 [Desulfobacterales bacterium]|nr:hypothetical protein [Desulfobacterales bacterium]
MVKIALLPSDAISRGAYISNKELPNNYMGDFTLMGFVVDRYREALGLLSSAGYHLDQQEWGTDIFIDTLCCLPEIKAIMAANNISCEFSDIADTLYQA